MIVNRSDYHIATIPQFSLLFRMNPVTWAGQEVLLIPVGQEEEKRELYRGLYDDEGLNEEILSELAIGASVGYQGSTL